MRKRAVPLLAFLMLFAGSASAQMVNCNGGGGGGSVTWATLPTITIVSIGANSHVTGATANPVTLPGSFAANDCLFLLGMAVQKPTSAISCPSGFTSLETSGQVSDGTYQPQTVVCSKVATGSESGTQSLTWTGSGANSNGMMIDVRGLTECTSPDAIYNPFNSSSTTMLAGGPALSPFGPNTLNIIAAASNTNFGLSPVAEVVNNSADAGAFGWALGVPGASILAGSNAYFAIAGALLH